MKTGELIQRIEDLLVQGIEKSDIDMHIPRPWIYSLLVAYRSKLIGQKINKKQFVSEWCKQTLRCIPLVSVPDNECECEGGLCTIKRTEYPVPELMAGLSDYAISRITSNGAKISLVKPNEANYIGYTRYASKKPIAYIRNGYVYVIASSFINSINITGLFEDPWEAAKWNAENTICEGTEMNKCDILSFDFPLDNDMADTITMLVVNEIGMGFRNLGQRQEKENEQKKADTNEED